ncbi:MAG: hypothetical protein GY773_00790 [Actinomycetia bacterium]|nr:hypothetical protein [Actinomycetes bacterium]
MATFPSGAKEPLKRAVERLVPGFDEGYRARDWTSVLTSTGDFLDSVEISVRHVVLMEAERYLNLWRSHNLLNAAAGPEGMAQSGRRTWGPTTSWWPGRCGAWPAPLPLSTFTTAPAA